MSVDADDLTAERAANGARLEAPVVIVLSTTTSQRAEGAAAFFRLANAGCTLPVIVRQDLRGLSADALQLKSSADLGGLLLDGLGTASGSTATLDWTAACKP